MLLGRSPSQSLAVMANYINVADKPLPAVEKIKSLHVYDFDNTLFNSPLPNPKLWNGPTVGFLQTQDSFTTGGWWHDSKILSATGDGLEKEEPRAWRGWWNERIVELIELSMQQKDALTVLLTGRSENGFAILIKRMLASKGLEPDMLVLKPAVGPNSEPFGSTMKFKLAFFETLMETYKTSEDIRVYEDRIRHVKDFRDFFMAYNTSKLARGNTGVQSSRGAIIAEVIQVADGVTQLDPVIETSEVQSLINAHNTIVSNTKRGIRYQIKKTVFYTGYLINDADTQSLLALANIPPNMRDVNLKYLANNILITPRPCPASILEKVGGIGSKMTWEVTGIAAFDNRIWAALVRPVPETHKIYTENPKPIVVLALRKGVRPKDANQIQNWQPIPPGKAFRFETTVGEKVLLRIEEEDLHADEYESLFPNKNLKRKHLPDEENQLFMSRSAHERAKSPNNKSSYGYNRGGHVGGGIAGRGRNAQRGRGNNRGTGGNRGGRGRGGYAYRALDDIGDKSNANVPVLNADGYDVSVAYEDFPPLQKQYQTPQQLVQQQFEQYQTYQQQQMQRNGGGVQKGGKGDAELHYF